MVPEQASGGIRAGKEKEKRKKKGRGAFVLPCAVTEAWPSGVWHIPMLWECVGQQETLAEMLSENKIKFENTHFIIFPF